VSGFARNGTRLMRRLDPGQFTSARICTDAGQVEVSLSDGGNWQLKARLLGELDWHFVCSGDLDGRVFVPPARDEAPIRLGPLRLDLAARRAEVDGAEVLLTEREFDLLAALASDPGRVFTKDELLRDVWGRPERGAIRTLDSHASKVRNKLREAGADGFIVNYWRIGYRLANGGW
jgi:DNA-binding response OmpR family regulator